MKKKSRKILIWTIAGVILAASLVCAVIGGDDGYSGRFSFPDLFDLGRVFAGKINSDLESFNYGEGGSMEGGGYSVTVTRWDDEHALISYSSSDWYYQDPTVSEYLSDDRILEDIKTVFNHYGMKAWHNKKFSDVEILDGASTYYHFNFEDDSIWFSSWYYPPKYGRRLDELSDIVDEYTISGEAIPGLVHEELTEDEEYGRYFPDDGDLRLIVNEYSSGCVCYRILNGRDEDAEILDNYLIKKADSNELIIQSDPEYDYTITAYSHDVSDGSVKLNELLEKGEYILEVGNLSCRFTIE